MKKPEWKVTSENWKLFKLFGCGYYRYDWAIGWVVIWGDRLQHDLVIHPEIYFIPYDSDDDLIPF